MKEGVNWIENQGENWYKMLQNCQITCFGKKNKPTLDQIIFRTKCECDKMTFLQKEEFNKIELSIKYESNKI